MGSGGYIKNKELKINKYHDINQDILLNTDNNSEFNDNINLEDYEITDLYQPELYDKFFEKIEIFINKLSNYINWFVNIFFKKKKK